MKWTAYEDCCHLSKLDEHANVCSDCGHILLRCPGFWDGCQQILSPDGHCQIHVAPRLSLVRKNLRTVTVGDCLTLPLLIENTSPLDDSCLFIRSICTKELGGSWEKIDLGWRKIESGDSRPFEIDTAELKSGGRLRIQIRIELAVGLGVAEESYAFSGAILFDVAQKDTRQIVQNIDLSGASLGTGAAGVVQTGPSISMGSFGSSQIGEALADEVLLQRLDEHEVLSGLRGYADLNAVVPWHVNVEFKGFATGDWPTRKRPFPGGTWLRCGRNSLRHNAERNPNPNDLCLRVYDQSSGQLKKERCWQISGVHFELFLQSGRFCLRSFGRAGTLHNKSCLEVDQIVSLAHGDVISPLPTSAQELAIRVAMIAQRGVVSKIILTQESSKS